MAGAGAVRGDRARCRKRLREQVLRGDGPETLLLCEHDPVVTLGRSANPAHVLAPRDELARRGVDVHAASRGGDVTYHGPGQLVGLSDRAAARRRGRARHGDGARDRERAGASWVSTRSWRRETPGLWIDSRGGTAIADAKICAFGVHVHRRVAIHGFALNVAGALDGFDLIVPCGLAASRTTSIAAAIGAADRSRALHVLASRVADALGRELGVPFDPARSNRPVGSRSIEMSEGITRMIRRETR